MTEQIKYCSVTVTTKYISKLKIEEHSEPAGFQHGMWDGRRVWHVWYRRELHTRWMGPRLAFIILRRVIPVVWSNNKNLVHYTYSRTQLYFTQQYSGNTTICFGSICGPSSGCDLTFQGSLYKNVGWFLAIGGNDNPLVIAPGHGTHYWNNEISSPLPSPHPTPNTQKTPHILV